ncbi:MAG: Asp-tRNA(Asn)/Glu-tRNA(Gln) amidotransferase subunit GatB [bacterium]|nr:Asp-tRNA(Asn)/Glu-tRNA(Gln) amidotransferase subunit GatB [bacterium]
MNKEYTPTIGIEVHVEVLSNTKIFSHSINGYSDSVNTNVNIIDLGYPGVLPRVNKEVVHKALKAALALNCSINKKMHFDRKCYYYPDLPKGYQITQNETPIGFNGRLKIDDDRYIDIEEMHIEEDTCKSIHVNGKTLLNYNRSGVPLIEIVSKPVIKSSDEAVKYLESLRELLLYLEVSDCKIEEGSMRADVNVSVSKTEVLGTKCEVKNIGSISNVKTAIEEEIHRQINILEQGGKIVPETRRFDSKTNTTVSMRKKEVGNDYRYIPDADIPYVILDDSYIESVKKSLVMLPNERRKIYKENEISDVNIDKLINNKPLSDFLDKFIDKNINLKIASNILLGDISSYLNKTGQKITNTYLENKFIDIVNSLNEGKMSSKNFKEIINDCLEKEDTLENILKENNISLVSNEDDLLIIINKVLEENKNSVNDYKNGKDNAFKYLMGMVMKETKGSANPVVVNNLLKDLLSKDVN